MNHLSRLSEGVRKSLRVAIEAEGFRIFALDLPTSRGFVAPQADDFTGRMFGLIDGMLLDVLAAVARKDYDDRPRRQVQGQAKTAGLYRGRKEDTGRNGGSRPSLGSAKAQSIGA